MSDDRLMRAMAAATPPRDPAFTLAVLRATEDARYRTDRLRRMLTGAGLAAAGGLLLVMVANAINADPSEIMFGAGAVALCATLLMTARTASRLSARRP